MLCGRYEAHSIANYVDSIVASTNMMIFKYANDMRLIKAMPSEGIKRPKRK